MKLTILGNNGPFPAAGGACSGYLVRSESVNIMIDCGNGTLANLQRILGFDRLDAIILTHLHSDHISDMHVLKYAVQIKSKRGTMDHPIKVYAPSEPKEEYDRLNARDAFILNPISEDTTLRIGDMRIGFSLMRHPYMNFAVAIECKGRRFVYSGDTAWTDAIVRFAKGADLLMLDAGLLTKDYSEGAPHLTAEQCGVVASEAGAGKLLLTHFWPEYDIGELLAEARASFANTEAAQILQDYDI
jgi:ribonuclease BN (tRNA processing enzyme)